MDWVDSLRRSPGIVLLIIQESHDILVRFHNWGHYAKGVGGGGAVVVPPVWLSWLPRN